MQVKSKKNNLNLKLHAYALMNNISDKKQVIILQDLGISDQSFQELIAKANLPFEFTTEKWDSISASETVEGIITVKEEVNNKILDHFPNTKFVAVAFTGYDSVDLDLCRERGIAVFNVPAYSTDSVAELVIGLAISLLREIPTTDKLIRAGGWNHKPGNELKGKSVGIVGTGTIGIRVAEIFKVLGCDIFGWSKSKQTKFTDIGGEYVSSLEELCSKVDLLSIHIPSMPDTKNLINKKHFEVMKPTAFIINTARGPIVNQKDLTYALNNDIIAGAAIDVYEEEPINSNDDLLKTENSILTPHIAYKTTEALKLRAEITFHNIKSFLANKQENRID